mgnify:FL=1
MDIYTQELPIFPLNTVLFPGETIPLQIFEDRYKLMINECIEKNTRFGVALIREGKEVGGPAIPYEIGTIVSLVDHKSTPDGRIRITCIGQEKFEIIEIISESPFLKALVRTGKNLEIDDVKDETLEMSHLSMSKHYNNLLSMKGSWVSTPYTPSDPIEFSYFISQILQLNVSEKQKLLEMDSCEMRLDTSRKYLEEQSKKTAVRSKIEILLKFCRQ